METITRNIEDLIVFHSVAKEGGFTRAAEVLGSSKAMMSKQIKRLEAALGLQLFIRTTRKLSLTQEGIALQNYTDQIFQLSDEAGKRLKFLAQGNTGSVRITTPVSLGEFFFTSFLPKVRELLPHVDFEADLSNEARDLSQDEVDFAIRATDSHHPDVIARHLGRLKDVLCVSRDFPSLSKLRGDPKVLREMPCILHSQESLWNRWTLSSPDGEVRIETQGRVSTNQYEMVRTFCRAGLGPARIPFYLVADDLRKGDLIQIFPEYQISTHSLYLVYLRSEFASQKLKVTKDVILRWFAERKEIFV